MAQPSKGQGVNGVCELLLTDATQITSECVKPIEATSRTFIQADVCFLKVFSLHSFVSRRVPQVWRFELKWITFATIALLCSATTAKRSL